MDKGKLPSSVVTFADHTRSAALTFATVWIQSFLSMSFGIFDYLVGRYFSKTNLLPSRMRFSLRRTGVVTLAARADRLIDSPLFRKPLLIARLARTVY